MSTSLYGTVKKVNSSVFVFDKIYHTRAEMESKKIEDGVYHGRYVLVTYGDKYSNILASNPVVDQNGNVPSYIYDSNVVHSNDLTLQQAWLDHYNTDLQAYKNIYDNTVWQKIYDGDNAKYIMVASLNARAPGLTINEDYYAYDLITGGSDTYYTKESLNDTNVTSLKNRKLKYLTPKWHETMSNDLIYHLDMPMPVRVHLRDNQIDYFKDGVINPLTRSEYTGTNDNYIRWEHVVPSGTQVTDADFSFHVPAIGQAVSDIYDALYGVPIDSNHEPTTGTRPFINEAATNGQQGLKDATWQALQQTDYQGILYILSKIGLRDPQDGHYYLSSDWAATSNQLGHIENKPQKITNVSVAATGLWTFTTAVNN